MSQQQTDVPAVFCESDRLPSTAPELAGPSGALSWPRRGDVALSQIGAELCCSLGIGTARNVLRCFRVGFSRMAIRTGGDLLSSNAAYATGTGVHRPRRLSTIVVQAADATIEERRCPPNGTGSCLVIRPFRVLGKMLSFSRRIPTAKAN